jgi:hypothetical protein
MDTMDIDDPNERETLPAPIPVHVPSADASRRAAAMRAFDTQAEVFFSSTATLPGATHEEPALAKLTEAEELAAWWVEQRRRSLIGWVAAAMALCAGLVVAGLIVAPV